MNLSYDIILGEMKKLCVGITTNAYTSSRPEATSGVKDFIICSLPIKQYDLGAYGQTICRFSLFAKDIAGVENYTELAEMQRALMGKLPINNDVCAIWEPVTLSGGSDKSGFHSLIIQCNMIIY